MISKKAYKTKNRKKGNLLKLMEIIKRMLKYGSHEQKILKKFSIEPHWILDDITINLKYQKHGISGELMAPIFKIAEKTHVSCLIITHNERNIHFYNKYGLKLILTEEHIKNGPQAYVCERKFRVFVYYGLLDKSYPIWNGSHASELSPSNSLNEVNFIFEDNSFLFSGLETNDPCNLSAIFVNISNKA
jgi:GNAT superfamily N-acetyltransferase